MSTVSSTKPSICRAGAALLVLALGCGGSTDTSTGSSGASGSGGSGGSGETGGAGGSSTGGSGGSGGETPDATVTPDGGDVICAGMVCSPVPIGTGMTLPACCTTQNACGVSVTIGGQATCYGQMIADANPSRPDVTTGVPDPTCASLMLGAFTLGGCCMTDNTCGFLTQIGNGCISLENLRNLNLPGINLPEGGVMSCVYPPP